MRTRWTLGTLCLLLSLAACDRTREAPPAPAVGPPATAAGYDKDNSVPSAESVFPSANDTPKPEAGAARANTAMTPRQESSAMPMAGQNNDHSAPLAPAKPASAPLAR